MYWGSSWEPWSGAAPKLLVWDYLIAGHALITHRNETQCILLDSLTQSSAGKVNPKKLCVGPLPFLGSDTKALACLQIKHSAPGPLD